MSSCPLSTQIASSLDLCRSWGCCLSLCELSSPLVSRRPCFLTVFHSNWLSHSTSSSTGFPEPVVAVTLTAQSILELRPRYDPPIDVKLAFVGDYAPDTYEGPWTWWPVRKASVSAYPKKTEYRKSAAENPLLCVHYEPEVLITECRSNGESANPIEGIHPLGQGGNSTVVCVPTTKVYATMYILWLQPPEQESHNRGRVYIHQLRGIHSWGIHSGIYKNRADRDIYE